MRPFIDEIREILDQEYHIPLISDTEKKEFAELDKEFNDKLYKLSGAIFNKHASETYDKSATYDINDYNIKLSTTGLIKKFHDLVKSIEIIIGEQPNDQINDLLNKIKNIYDRKENMYKLIKSL